MKRKAIISIAAALLLLGGIIALVLLLSPGRNARVEPLARNAGKAAPGALETPGAPGTELAAAGAEAAAPAGEETSASSTLELPPPLLRGRVTGEGSAVAGATVRLFAMKRVEASIDKLEASVTEAGGTFPDVPLIIQMVREELASLKESAIAARTGEDGIYEYRGIEPGAYIALTLADGWLFRYGDVASLSEGKTETLDLDLDRGASIAGRVVGASGRGVPAASVLAEFRPGGSSGMGTIIRRALRLVNGEFLKGPFETRTGEDGAFRLASLPPGLYDLRAEGRAGLEARLDGVEAGSEDALIYMGGAAGVKGAFTETGGSPAAGAVFWLEREEDTVQLQGPLAMWGGVAHALERQLQEKPSKHEAGRRGEFHVRPLGPGKYRLSVDDGLHLPFSKAFALQWGETLDAGVIVLDPGDSIQGTVRSEGGAPIPRARVLATPANINVFSMGAMVQDAVSGKKSALADASGAFRLQGLVKGTYRLTAMAPGHATAVKRGVATGEAAIEIILRRGSRIEGRLVENVPEESPEEKPVAGAKVRAEQAIARSGEDGRFVLDGVAPEDPRANPFVDMAGRDGQADASPPGTSVTVRASAPGFLEGKAEVDLASPEPDLTIRLARAPEIRGVALDPEGQPLAGALVRLTPVTQDDPILESFFNPDLIFLAASVTDLEGKFHFSSFRWGREGQDLRVIGDHPLHARGASKGFEVKASGETPEIEVRLSAAARVKGTVTDGSSGIGAAVVRLRKAPKNERNEAGFSMLLGMMGLPKGGDVAYTKTDGAFAYERLVPGDYVISAEAPGFTDSPSTAVTVGPGEERELTMTLDPGGEIAGSVADAAGAPISAARVRILREPAAGADETSQEVQMAQAQALFGGAFKSGRSAEDGSFRVRGLPAETYTIAVSRAGFTPAELKGIVPGKEKHRVVLQRAAGLRGVVRDAASGEPIPRFRVMIGEDVSEEFSGLPREDREHSDPEGRFARDDLAPGKLVIRVGSPGYAPVREDLLFEAGAVTEREFLLAEAGRIRGVVIDLATGQPVQGAEVGISPGDELDEKKGDDSAGGARRRARLEKARRERDEGTSEETEPTESEDARALSEHFVSRWASESVTSGEDGSFLLEGVPRGPRTLVASHESYIPEAKRGVEVRPGQELEARLALRPGLSCAGTVRDAAGKPAPGCFVFLRGASGETSHIRKSVISNRDGSFRIIGLEQGTYRLVVPANGSTAPRRASLSALEALDVEIREDVSGLEVALPGETAGGR